MAMNVRTNVAAISAAGQLAKTTKALSKTLERISSGLRINRAADDAAGLGVATNLESASISQIQGMRNANDGISIIQTAESATNEITDILQRMRELAIQSSSETLDNDERSYIEDEFVELSEEVERIAQSTEFNGLELGNNTNTQLDVQVGIQNSTTSRISLELGDLRSTSLGVASTQMSLSSVTSAQSALDSIDLAIDSVNSFRSGLGAAQNRLDSAINNAQNYVEALTAAESRIRDADFAIETSELTKQQILQQSGVAALAQAKNMNQAVISLLS
jgi:flagellin